MNGRSNGGGFRSGGSSRELVRLLTLERKNGDEELRFSVDEFEPSDGKRPAQYLSIRLWYKDQSGEWRPSKTGCTIRQRECEKALMAFARAEKILSGKERIGAPQPEQPADDDQPGMF